MGGPRFYNRGKLCVVSAIYWARINKSVSLNEAIESRAMAKFGEAMTNEEKFAKRMAESAKLDQAIEKAGQERFGESALAGLNEDMPSMAAAFIRCAKSYHKDYGLWKTYDLGIPEDLTQAIAMCAAEQTVACKWQEHKLNARISELEARIKSL